MLVSGGGKEGAAMEAPLAVSLAAEGFELGGVFADKDDLAQRAGECRPDVIVIEAPSPNRRLLTKIEAIRRQAPRPIALFCDEGDTEQINAAVEAGVNALVTSGDGRQNLASTIDLAIAQFKETDKLLKQRDRAATALAERKDIERAKGIVMKQRGLDEDAAYKFLRQAAMSRNVRLGRLAASIVEAEELLS